ncbi:MAG: SdrD B-like domain-containing protein [Candidatus Microbacterium colombiense]|nr:MAG: SdrD B-like domain-containing protein [Microbacterium sp.]
MNFSLRFSRARTMAITSTLIASAAFGGSAIFASPAVAAEETLTVWSCDSAGPYLTEWNVDRGTAPVLEVPQFDPSLGTFLRAEVRFEVTAHQTLGMDVYADPLRNPYHVTHDSTVYAQLAFAGGSIDTDVRLAGSADLVSDGTTPDGDFEGADALTFDQTTTETSPVATFTDPSWVGPGNVTAVGSTLSSLSVRGAGGNLIVSQRTEASASLCVRYAYVPAAPPVRVSIGDYTWWDHDRDGVQDAGEPPVAGVTVELRDAGGTIVATTITDASGHYAFTDLQPDTDYTVDFGRPAGASFTTARVGDASSDSNPRGVDGVVAVHTPLTGGNSAAPGSADDPTIDAGYVRYNLTLEKTLASTGPFLIGSTVSFTLVPRNEGPSSALAGWSVTDVLPTSLLLVSMTGEGYDCDAATCTSGATLDAGESGAPITVTATVAAGATGVLKNVAYVAPSPRDTAETNPLTIPTRASETTMTPTDNDSEAQLELTAISPSGPAAPSTPSAPPVTSSSHDAPRGLALTGADSSSLGIAGGIGLALVFSGVLALTLNRRRVRAR